MKVLEISVRSDISGGPKHLLSLLTHRPKEIELYSAIPYGFDLTKELITNSVKTLDIPHRKFSIKKLIELYLFCRKNKITTIHSHGRGAGYYSRILKLFGFKIIHTFHGVHTEPGFISQVKMMIDRVLMPFTDQFICVSNGEKIKALKYKVATSKNIRVIPNGVKIRTPHYNHNDIPQIAMLGRLTPTKGYLELITFIENFCHNNKEFKFAINIAGTGDKDFKAKLQEKLSQTKFAKKHITFVGLKKDPIEFLKTNTHFLSFSHFEGMPISILEAMSVGLPCMVSNVVGNNDIINNQNGLLFELNQLETFNDIYKVFLTSDHSKRIQKALQDISTKFNIQNQVNLTITSYY